MHDQIFYIKSFASLYSKEVLKNVFRNFICKGSLLLLFTGTIVADIETVLMMQYGSLKRTVSICLILLPFA